MFNLLTDKLPSSVVVDGTEYIINWYATTMIQLSVLIEDSAATGNYNIADKELELFYPVVPDNKSEAMEKLIEFYSCANFDYGNQKTDKTPDTQERRHYSYKYDSHLIYSAFAQQYPMVNIEILHWFEFKALLEGLTDDCLFSKVMKYRAIKIDSKMSKEEKRFYRKMKKLYALPDNRPKEVINSEFGNALWSL